MNSITLETLLLSIQTEEVKDEVISRLRNSTLLDTDDISLINEYESIYEDTNKIPSPSILVNINPQYTDMPIITNEKDLLTYVSMFIKERLKTSVSSKIINNIQSLNNGDKRTREIADDIINEAQRLNIIDEQVERLESVEDVVEIYNEDDVSDRFKTGLEPIDNICGGIPTGSVTIVMGGTGSFKTMTTTNICYNAMKNSKNICYFSLEVTQKHMYYNFVSRHSIDGSFSSGIPHKDLKNKSLTEEQMSILKDIARDYKENIPGKCIVIDETKIKSFDITGFETVIANVDKQLTEETGHGVDILVVDHAQLLKFSGTTRINDPYAIVNYYVSWLRQLSLNFLGQKRPISVIIVSQTSRAGLDYANKHGGQYLLTHAAEANEIERSASYIISLYANDMTRSSNELMVQLIKSRNSETMLEPQPVKINPVYYMVGSSFLTDNVSPVFDQNIVFNQQQDFDLQSSLESIFED